MQRPKAIVEWNSKAIIELVREMAIEQEQGAAQRMWADARSHVPVGKYGHYRYFKRRVPLLRRKGTKDSNNYKRGKEKKDWQLRRAGRLFRSIVRVQSKYGEKGGTLVWMGNTRIVWYSHFIEFGTVFMKRRRGYRILTNAINRERRRFVSSVRNAVAGDM